MIKLDEAIQQVMRHAIPREQVEVSLAEALGMVLAEDIISDIDMPPFDKAVMDGFAIRSEDISHLPTILNIIGEARAGSRFTGIVEKMQAVGIMTGAPVPDGANAVVKVEDTELIANNQVRILTNVSTGNFITPRGEHTITGATVLTKGTVIRSLEIAILATVGREKLKVFRRPTVFVIATGDELVPANTQPSGDQIRDANTPLLNSLLQQDGISANILGIVRDDKELFIRAIRTGLSSDVLLISGGVSAGKYDMIPEILALNGVEKIFHKVNIKPGKPVFFGKTNRTLVFGIPGNPISAFTAYKLFVSPALQQMSGHKDKTTQRKTGVLAQTYRKTDPRLELLPVKIALKNNFTELIPVPTRGSADIFSLCGANAFAFIDKSEVCTGETVEFIRW